MRERSSMAATSMATVRAVKGEEFQTEPLPAIQSGRFTMGRQHIARIISLPEDQVGPLLDEVFAEFSQRHQQIRKLFLERFEQVRELLLTDENTAPGRGSRVTSPKDSSPLAGM